MPSRSKAQQHLAGMELARKRAGKEPKTSMGDMPTEQLTDFAATKTAKLPHKVTRKGKK